MKRLYTFLMVLSFIVLTTVQVSVAKIEAHESPTTSSFEINNIIDYAQLYGIRHDNAVIKVPINLSLNEDVNTGLIVEITPLQTKSSGVLNFTMSGNFYKTSNDETVSVYGLSGSFEYTGSDTEITGKDSYHNSTLEGWRGTSRCRTSKSEPYSISVLTGHYTLYQNGNENNTAQIKVAVSENGVYSVGGDYTSYDVN